MIITTLVENTSVSKDYKSKHGLSLHIKTNSNNILFDVGPDDTFIKNAEKLGVDISKVEILIISHGHNDHGGGLKTFLENNSIAKIYISKFAFENYYAKIFKICKVYIGLDKKMKSSDRIILTDSYFKIDDGISLVSNVQGTELRPSSNKMLCVVNDNGCVEDNFNHEQSLILDNEGETILISGCSHTGVLNILKESEELIGKRVDKIIGGLHLFNPVNKKSESKEFINCLANQLLSKEVGEYTCHCTGTEPFKQLKEIMGDKIDKLAVGSIITL